MPSSRYFLGLLPWYSVLIVCGICAALFLCKREEKRLHLPHDLAIDLALYIIPLGIIGARLYYVVFSWEMFRNNLLSILMVWHGGLAIYGGVIGGFLGVCLYALSHHMSISRLCDIIVPGLALAQAIGRWGNFFNMEAYGLPVTNPALQFFPLAVLIPSGGQAVWHMATFFYESMWDLLVFSLLYLTRTRMRRKGDTTLWYLLLYGCGRLVIEQLRMDSLLSSSGSIRVSQLLSACLMLAALLVFALRALRACGMRMLVACTAAGALSTGVCLALRPAIFAFPLCALLLTPVLFLLFSCLYALFSARALPGSVRRLWLGLLPLAASLACLHFLTGAQAAALPLQCLCLSAASLMSAVWLYPALPVKA